MNKEDIQSKLLSIAWEANQDGRPGMRLPVDVLGTLYKVLTRSGGWESLDQSLRNAFPEMYDNDGRAKTKFLRHYKKELVRGGGYVLLQMTEQEVKDLYAPANNY